VCVCESSMIHISKCHFTVATVESSLAMYCKSNCKGFQIGVGHPEISPIYNLKLAHVKCYFCNFENFF